jgi:NADPH:quinone reductase
LSSPTQLDAGRYHRSISARSAAVRAARIHAAGEPPRVDEVPEPKGTDVLTMDAVAINPVDRAIGAGTHYVGQPPVPYVVGSEGVGHDEDGRSYYVFGGGLGTVRDGTLAETAAVPDGSRVPLPDGVDPRVAVASGIAGVAGWVPVTRVASVGPDDTVLVLAATGSVGRTAVQAARVRGARRIVAAGRNREALERDRSLGADASVVLEGAVEELAAAFAEACGGDGATVVIDPLWGEPAAAAVRASARGARIVNIGNSAGPEATLLSSDVRGKQLHIVGYSNFALSPEELRESYLELVRAAMSGEVSMDYEAFSLDDVKAAWERSTSGGSRVVVSLGHDR